MRLTAGGALGDEIAMTAVIREYKKKFPDEMVRIFQSMFPDVWKYNPNLKWGNLESGKVLRIGDWFGNLRGSIPHLVAKQLGFELVNDTPELWLSAEEQEVDYGLPDSDRLIAIDPWAMRHNRRWPYFEELSKQLTDSGWVVVEVGASKAPPIDCAVSLNNKLTIRETMAVLARCSLYVGNDSGLFHMAAAVGTPQIVLFGPTPWQARAYWNTLSLWSYRECAPGCASNCVRREAPGKPRDMCINDIPIERVRDAVGIAATRWLVGIAKAPALHMDPIRR